MQAGDLTPLCWSMSRTPCSTLAAELSCARGRCGQCPAGSGVMSGLVCLFLSCSLGYCHGVVPRGKAAEGTPLADGLLTFEAVLHSLSGPECLHKDHDTPGCLVQPVAWARLVQSVGLLSRGQQAGNDVCQRLAASATAVPMREDTLWFNQNSDVVIVVQHLDCVQQRVWWVLFSPEDLQQHGDSCTRKN